MINKIKVQTAAASSATIAALEVARHDWIRVVSPGDAIYLAGLFARYFCAGMLGCLVCMVTWDLFSRWRNSREEEISESVQEPGRTKARGATSNYLRTRRRHNGIQR